MTTSIDARTRATEPTPPESNSDSERKSQLIIGVRLFTAAAVLAAVALAVADLASHGGVHLIIPAATCLILAGLGGHLLVVDQLLAGRRSFYLRGHLTGWHLGWRGLPPEADDPLTHR